MKIGVIGGSGLYDMDGLKSVKTKRVKTPFGSPSDAYICGKMGKTDVFFLPRHGRGHRLLPSEIPHKANIYGFKVLGADSVISISAVGSLRAEYRPMDVVLPDQYFDRTKQSLAHTFFGNGVVGHVGFGEPTCKSLKDAVAAAARKVIKRRKNGVRLHVGGTYVNMEGPAFSTKSESLYYRKLGFDVIGMTSLAEAKLCREAEMCYQAVTMITDYDCWHETKEQVTVEMIIGYLMRNVSLAKEIIAELAGSLPARRTCGCDGIMKYAIITDRKMIPGATKKALMPILGKYL